MIRAKKSLGQHFLKSERALNKIVEAGEINPHDTILEIGPGEGALTEKLLAYSSQLIAIEKDDSLYEYLKEKFQNEISLGKLNLIHGDILDFDLEKLQATSYKLVANIPYNITGAILKKFLQGEFQPTKMILLVQDEVAKRILARNGKESLLSISVKVYGEVRYVEKVLAGSFAPSPKVDSAIIEISNISKSFFNQPSGRFSEEEFFKLIKAGFSSKRKKLSSNLSTLFNKEVVAEAFTKIGLDENARAEDISTETWKKLLENLKSRDLN